MFKYYRAERQRRHSILAGGKKKFWIGLNGIYLPMQLTDWLLVVMALLRSLVWPKSLWQNPVLTSRLLGLRSQVGLNRVLTSFSIIHISGDGQWVRDRFLLTNFILPSTHCKDKIPKFRNKYSQKGNIGVSVPISTFMRLWAIYIFPRSVCLFCWIPIFVSL